MKLIVVCIFHLLLLSACASKESIDRGTVSLPNMDVRSENILGQPSPKSGLRTLGSASGSGSCSACAK